MHFLYDPHNRQPSLKQLVQPVTHLIYIWEVPGSSLNQETCATLPVLPQGMIEVAEQFVSLIWVDF
jgi:hypothetical protein